MALDQYYTRNDIAARCVARLYRALPSTRDKRFIEPSAGDGSFFELLPQRRRVGLDLEPRAKGILKADFLSWSPPKNDSDRHVVIGNPPFGHRSALAVDFFNHAASMADVVAFVVPRQFQKYSVHSRLNKDFRLIVDQVLPDAAFRTPAGKPYAVRSVFQVWTRQPGGHKNLRILTPPPTSHPDFQMYQYNNTPEAKKAFKEDWDFAVPRQGFEDYTRRETDAAACELNKQWILFKAKTPEVRERLYSFDFAELARKNTVVYGFGKADVVMAYKRKHS